MCVCGCVCVCLFVYEGTLVGKPKGKPTLDSAARPLGARPSNRRQLLAG